jgi:hypothetical protein
MSRTVGLYFVLGAGWGAVMRVVQSGVLACLTSGLLFVRFERGLYHEPVASWCRTEGHSRPIHRKQG